MTPQFIWQTLRCVVFCKFLPLTCFEVVIHLGDLVKCTGVEPMSSLPA